MDYNGNVTDIKTTKMVNIDVQVTDKDGTNLYSSDHNKVLK